MSDFEARLQRLIRDPESLAGFWLELTGPIWRWLEFAPELQVSQLRAYVEVVTTGTNLAELWPSAARAHAEFDASLRSLERAQRLFKTVDPQLLNWAERIYRVLLRTDRARDALQASEPQRARTLAQSIRVVAPGALSHLAPEEARSKPARLRVDTFEALVGAAHAETDFLGRRRRLLQAAREVLIATADQLTSQRDVGARLEAVAREMGDIDRLQAMGVRDDVALPHQLIAAQAERQLQRVNGILTTLESHSLLASNERVAELSNSALAQLWRGRDRFADEHRAASVAMSGRETFQTDVLDAALRGSDAAKAWLGREMTEITEQFGLQFARAAHRHVHGDAANELIQAALYVDGCVDVGGVLAPHRILERVHTIREVRHPTARLALVPATGVDDLRDALIHDPRTILPDLATGRLLTRRYLGQQHHEHPRRVMASEVRIFLLDGSGSMLGPRARMRDAIVVAELSTMIARLNDPNRWLTPTLYYRYFTRRLGDVRKVTTAQDAISAVEHVLGELRHGGTDIEGALLGSFETLREARENADYELARAQIVLITDGESPVDDAALLAACDQAGSTLGVSIIALGQENPTLRVFARTQRERGQRVFYQHLDDDLLQRLVEGQLTSLTLHLPDAVANEPPGEALAKVLDEIIAVQRSRDTEALQRARDLEAAESELALARSEQARILSLARDAQTLSELFRRWFPPSNGTALHAEVTDVPARELQPSETDSALLDVIESLLAAVAEVVELIGGDSTQRRVDAIEMFERLLMEQRLSFLHYQTLRDRYAARLQPALGLIWAATSSESARNAAIS